MRHDEEGTHGPSRAQQVLLMLGFVLLAANLRPALTSVAPLIGLIRTDTGISNGVAGLLTALPLLAFGVLSPIAPRLAHRFGMERVLLASMLVLAVGILLRSAGAVPALFLGTVLLGASIAVGNVLLPSIVKREFPERAGLMTSTYSTALAVSAAIAAGASFPIAHHIRIGWRGLWPCGLSSRSWPVWRGFPRSGVLVPETRPPELLLGLAPCGARRSPGR